MGTTRLAHALDALHRAEAEPARSVPVSKQLLRDAKAAGDLAAASVAERALGIAALHLQDTDLATRHLRAAVSHARRADDAALAAEARMRLAGVLNVRGRPDAALREIDEALEDAAGVDRARAFAQQGAILVQLGRLDAAAASFEHAVPGLRAAGDRMWLKRVLANRGIVHARRYRFAAAEADLHEALQLNRDLGIELSVAFIEQNLGWLDTLRGDVPRALQHLGRAESTMRRLGAQLGFLLEDKANVLMSVGLVGEAREAAAQSVAALEREHQRIALPDVRLLLARASVLDGDVEEALRQARRAAREFARQGRPEAHAQARVTIALARASGPDRGRVSVGELVRNALALERAGARAAALEARLLAATLAGERGRGDARAQLLEAARRRRRGPAAERAMAWHAEALLRLADGRRSAALGAFRAGLHVLDEHRGALGATELRASSGRQRAALAALGMRTALDGGRTAQILNWAEQGRASHLLLPRLLPPDDDELIADLARLRVARADADAFRAKGADPTGAVRRQVEAERRIRDRARRLPGVSGGAAISPVPLADLQDALHDTALVEFVELDGALHAVAVVSDRAACFHLGSAAEAAELASRLPFALHRLARGQGAVANLVALLEKSARRLDTLVFGPSAAFIGDRPLIVVPTGPLQSLPWSVLPSCAGRPVTVAPSATTWHAAHAQAGRQPHSRAVVIAGPQLPGAHREAEAVARIYRTVAMSGANASVDAVLARLAGACVAHFAAHGSVHPQHASFSSVLLADGPLTGYDIETLQPVPRLIVLASCDTGRHDVRAGDELLGLTATFLARGAAQVIAPVVPVADAETAGLMTALHTNLAAGMSGAEALAAAQRSGNGCADQVSATHAGFVCMGSSFRLPKSLQGPTTGDCSGKAR